MAAWIKFEVDTPDKPEVRRMARALAIDADMVVGKLLRVWAYFDRNAVDGRVDGLVDADVDDIARLNGFASAMRAVGWLILDDDARALRLPHFDRHNGESAKKRALSNRAQIKWRASRNSPVDDRVDGHTSTPASTREDKSREELNTRKASPSLSGAAPDVTPLRKTNPPPNARTLLNAQAVQAIEFLNKVSESRFQPVEANVRPAAARIREFGLTRVKAVIAAKAEQWRGDEKMEQYLRPATLFAASNFANYEGQTARPQPEAVNG